MKNKSSTNNYLRIKSFVRYYAYIYLSCNHGCVPILLPVLKIYSARNVYWQ